MVLLFFSSLSPFVASSMPPSLVSSPLTSIRHPMLHPVGQTTGPQGTPQGKTYEMSWSCLRCHCVLRILLPRNKLPSASSVIMTVTLSVRQTVPTLRTAWLSPHWGRLIGSPQCVSVSISFNLFSTGTTNLSKLLYDLLSVGFHLLLSWE